MLDTLPSDILLIIINKTKYIDTLNLLKVNKTFNKFIKDNKQHIDNDYNDYDDCIYLNQIKYPDKLIDILPNINFNYDMNTYNKSTNNYIKSINKYISNLYSFDCSSRTDITDKFFESINFNNARRIKHLDLRCCDNFTHKSLDNSALHNIEVLDLRCTKISNINVLGKFHNLKKLYLSNCQNINDNSLEQGALRNLDKLKIIWLSDFYDITDDFIKKCEFKNFYELEELDLSYTCITNCSLEYIAQSNLKNLKKLSLRCCDKINNISILGRITSLVELDVSANDDINDNSISPGSFDNLHNLEILILTEANINNLGFLKNLYNLKKLYLDETNINNSSLNINVLKNLCKLHTLNLDWCKNISDISSLNNLCSLKRLTLRGCKKISKLYSECNRLEELDLYCCENITTISEFRTHNYLKRLNIYGCENIIKYDYDTITFLRKKYVSVNNVSVVID